MKRHSDSDLDSCPSDNDKSDDDACVIQSGIPGRDRLSLSPVERKDLTLELLLAMESRGALDLKPFYQRGFKWKQKQASLWIESVLLGYPCPEITLIRTEDGYGVFDGQQRITSLKLFIQNRRADTWKNREQPFTLIGLGMLKELEGKHVKQLDRKQRDSILIDFTIRCTIIPQGWPMINIIDFFKRIQGGGTRMTDQELRRAISRGAFTEMLDMLVNTPPACFSSLIDSLERAKVKMEADEYQELYLRFFTLQFRSTKSFGIPSIQQQGLDVMKELNRAAQTPEGSRKIEEAKHRLRTAIEVSLIVFSDPETMFRRAMPLEHTQSRVWSTTNRINKYVWDCFLYVFSNTELKGSIIANSEAVHDAFIYMMQTSDSFQSMKKTGTEDRICVASRTLGEVLSSRPTIPGPVYGTERRSIIATARQNKIPCSICGQALPSSDALVQVDHVWPRSKGGSSSSSTPNLSAVHAYCNNIKGNAASV